MTKSTNSRTSLAQIQQEPTSAKCSLCGRERRLLPPFDEYLWGKPVTLQLCEECYNDYGEDEHWLLNQLENLTSAHQLATPPNSQANPDTKRALSPTPPPLGYDGVGSASRLSQVPETEASETVGSNPGGSRAVQPLLATLQRLQQQQEGQHTQANPLRRYRLQQNLSYKELSQLSGLDRSTLRKLEQGHIRARASTLRKLAQALQIPLSELEYLGQGQHPGGPGSARIRRKDYDAELPQQQLRGGKLLLRLRLERGMTQVELARACGTKRAVISWLENEVYPAKKDKHLQRIAHYLGVSPADIAPHTQVQLTLKLD